MTTTTTRADQQVSTQDPPPSPRPFPLVRHSLALARRSLIKTRRTPGNLGDATIVPIIFLVMFVSLFGGAVSGSTHQYLQYIFPAVLVLTIIMSGMMATGINL